MGDAYLETVARLEPEITPVDLTAAAASIAISLKRIADVAEKRAFANVTGEDLAAILRTISAQSCVNQQSEAGLLRSYLNDLAKAIESGRLVRHVGGAYIFSVGEVGEG